MFRIDKCRNASQLLSFRNGMNSQRGLTGRFRPVDFNDTSFGVPSYSQCRIQGDRAGRDDSTSSTWSSPIFIIEPFQSSSLSCPWQPEALSASRCYSVLKKRLLSLLQMPIHLSLPYLSVSLYVFEFVSSLVLEIKSFKRINLRTYKLKN